MPSIDHDLARHQIIDQRPGHYLCFPDLCRAGDGRLLLVYREADRHVARRRKLLLRHSEDGGRSWSLPRVLDAAGGHCPRLARLDGDQLVCIDDDPHRLHWSLDHGLTWADHPADGFSGHGIPDRVLELGPNTLLTAAHQHRGSHPHPAVGQPPTEPMSYLSEDRGRTWRPLSVMAHGPHLVLCEASMARLPDGRVLALLRENSHVFEPMYAVQSRDQGRTWSEPAPTPLIGHRPTLGLTRDGRLLVTYRDTGPARGVSAWLGAPEDLLDGQGFAVHGRDHGAARLTDQGLLLDGSVAGERRVLYALRSLTDPGSARAALDVEVQVLPNIPGGCGIRFGLGWFLEQGRIRAAQRGASPVPLPTDRPARLRFVYEPGQVSLWLEGRRRRTYRVPMDVSARPVLVGSPPGEGAMGRSLWTRLTLRISEPRYQREYAWEWTPAHGMPDAWVRENVLVLRREPDAVWPDFGYTGWSEVADNEFLCAYHFARGAVPGYEPGLAAHIASTRFFASDFSA